MGGGGGGGVSNPPPPPQSASGICACFNKKSVDKIQYETDGAKVKCVSCDHVWG